MSIEEKIDALLETVARLEAVLTAPVPPKPMRYTLKALAEAEGRSVKFLRKQIRLRRLHPLPGSHPYLIDGVEVERWRSRRAA